MGENYLITEEGMRVLDDMKDRLDSIAPHSVHTEQPPDSVRPSDPLRGYLMQPISRGGSGLCAVVTRRPEYRSWKLDLAGIIYIGADEGRFQLRFTKDGDFWFDTSILGMECTIGELIAAITDASGGEIDRRAVIGCLGNPTQATNLVINDDLYPAIQPPFRVGQMIDSKIGSWIFAIHRSFTFDYDIDLLFTLSTDPDVVPVQLNGPAVMTLEEIKDSPTGNVVQVTDILDIPSPTPLQGGSKVVCIPFADIDYGIIAAYPRDLFMEQPSSS